MGNLFGVRRQKPLITAQDKAILQLKQQRDKIKIYQKQTETKIAESKGLAIKLFRDGKQERALVLFRRQKFMENIIDRTEKQLETLEQLVADIEYSQVEVSVVEGLKVGSEALKQLNALMNIDDIQQMMEDTEEAAEKQKQITDLLKTERFDEDHLLDELRELQVEQTLVTLPDVPEKAVTEQPTKQIIDELPEVPDTPMFKEEEGDEKEPIEPPKRLIKEMT